MTTAARGATVDGTLVPAHQSGGRLYSSRVHRRFEISDDYLLKGAVR